jgi:hypothetical protein
MPVNTARKSTCQGGKACQFHYQRTSRHHQRESTREEQDAQRALGGSVPAGVPRSAEAGRGRATAWWGGRLPAQPRAVVRSAPCGAGSHEMHSRQASDHKWAAACAQTFTGLTCSPRQPVLSNAAEFLTNAAAQFLQCALHAAPVEAEAADEGVRRAHNRTAVLQCGDLLAGVSAISASACSFNTPCRRQTSRALSKAKCWLTQVSLLGGSGVQRRQAQRPRPRPGAGCGHTAGATADGWSPAAPSRRLFR